MRFFLSPKRGFTLIEILVVAAIIAILAAVVIANVQQGRKKAADTARIANLQQIQVALRVYKEAYGRYPTGCPAITNVNISWSAPGPDLYLSINPAFDYFQCGDDFMFGLAPNFISQLPDEDRYSNPSLGQNYLYRTNLDGSEYKLLAHQIVETGIVPPGEPFARCQTTCNPDPWCFTNTYAVYSPGAACW